jgi:hypothetical protein
LNTNLLIAAYRLIFNILDNNRLKDYLKALGLEFWLYLAPFKAFYRLHSAGFFPFHFLKSINIEP